MSLNEPIKNVSALKDWDVKELRDIILRLESGVSVNSERNDQSSSGFGVLKTSCVNGGIFNPKEYKSIIPKEIARASLNPQKDSIIISRMNTPDLVGESAYVNQTYLSLFLPDRLWQTVMKPESKVLTKWLSYVIQSKQFRQMISNAATGTSGSMKNISQASFLGIKILVPTLLEQVRISHILTSVDNLIEKTKSLITKYQSIEQGMMYDLFTRGLDEYGELRPAYEAKPNLYKQSTSGWIPTNWEDLKLKDISTINQGLQIAIQQRYKTPAQGRHIYITIQYLNNPDSEANTYYIRELNQNVICNEDDILVTRTGNTGSIITGTKGVFHNNFFKVKYNSEKVLKDYLVLHLRRNEIQQLIMNYAGVTTIPDLKHKDFYNLPFPCPPKKEQEKIAIKLMNIQKIIDLEKNYLQKMQQIKLGIVDDLLAGKVRANINSEEQTFRQV